MQKIPTLFQRNHDTDHLVRNEVTPGCEWVLAGEGKATEKLDGSCCLIRDGKLYKRYELKAGKTPPPDFEVAQAPDPVTGKQPGWVPVGEGPEDQWHREAWRLLLSFLALESQPLLNGTYELVGPKVQGDPHGFEGHHLFPHGHRALVCNATTFEEVRECLAQYPYIEGIVWHHADGRMAKIKQRDFGFEWPYRPGKRTR